MEGGDSVPSTGPPQEFSYSDYRVVVDEQGSSIIVVQDNPFPIPPLRTDLEGAPVMIAVTDGEESRVDPVDSEAVGLAAGIVFQQNRRLMVSPEPSVLMVVRVSGSAVTAFSRTMDYGPEQVMLSASHSYTAVLPDNFSLLPVRQATLNVMGNGDIATSQDELFFGGQLVGILRPSQVSEDLLPPTRGREPESRLEGARRLGWITRRHPGALRFSRRFRRRGFGSNAPSRDERN
jgi:hypothetical protein